jgi:hypothetical protein
MAQQPTFGASMAGQPMIGVDDSYAQIATFAKFRPQGLTGW